LGTQPQGDKIGSLERQKQLQDKLFNNWLRMVLTAENTPLNHVVEETIDLR